MRLRLIILIFGFAVIAHVKCQVNVEDILYGEDDEEDDADDATTTTARPRRTRTTTTPPPATTVNVRQRQEPINPNVTTLNLGNVTGVAALNHTFVVKPANNTFFGTVLESSAAGTGAVTERVHYVLGQVGSIWNNVGKLNVTGIVDQALGIRDNHIARPLVTTILNVVLCNPFTFSNNNCQKRDSSGGLFK